MLTRRAKAAAEQNTANEPVPEESTEAAPAQPPRPDSEGFEVEMIVADRVWHGKRQFLLKWKNYDTANNTWENEADLHCESLLAEYLSRNAKPPRKKRAKENPPKEGAPARKPRLPRAPKEKPAQEGDGNDHPDATPKPRAKAKAAMRRRASNEDPSLYILFPEFDVPTGNPKIEILNARLQAGVWYYLLKVDDADPIEESSDFVRVIYPAELVSFLQNLIGEQIEE
jgi:hypothetical protein